MSERLPEERFVEAQRKLWKALTQIHSLGYYITHEADMRQAVDAFADMVCTYTWSHQHVQTSKSHIECRARLIKEVFGE